MKPQKLISYLDFQTSFLFYFDLSCGNIKEKINTTFIFWEHHSIFEITIQQNLRTQIILYYYLNYQTLHLILFVK